jgi:eukaryotic-like serine/threonine-protein kinase
MPEWKVPGYTELKMLGSGGFGDVVLARHDASGVLVAIKYLHQGLLADAEFAEMFRGEATVLASLDDPNVVRLYEYVEAPTGAAIVMELIGGVSLREILTYQGKTTAEAALVVLQGSLMGLAAAHRRGVVHRDYKPENVLVNGDGVSKLTDFGIAARAGDRPVPAGTLAYAAPEQMTGAPAGPASDVYSATATFYECLTGRPPFSGESEDLLRRHRSEPVPLDPVPEPLRPLVATGMAKDPARRPTDASTFIAELKTAATGAYGRHWDERGRSHLGEAALLLAALWPSGAPPTMQGTTAHRIRLFRHVSAVKAAIAAGAAIAVVAAGTALAVTSNSSYQPSAADHAVAVQSFSLQSSPALLAPSPGTGSPTSPITSNSGSPGSSGSPVPRSPTSSSTGPSTTKTSTTPVSPPTTTRTSTRAPQVPQITSVGTYTQGELVYFDIDYSDPGNDAEGFGFVGVDGSGWAEENHPFSSPSYGIVGTDSIAYPFNVGCGTAQQQKSSVEAWIYDTAGDRSAPVDIQLVCTT